MKQYSFFVLLFVLLGAVNEGFSQEDSLSIEKCYSLARENYPAIQKMDLIARAAEFDVKNANRKYLPQLNLSSSMSYSYYDVAGDVQNVELNNGQYGAQANLNQLIYDGGETRYQKKLAIAQSDLQSQQLETELYALKNRINQVFFGIILLDLQLEQIQINRENLESQFKKIEAMVENGVLLRSNLDELRVELMNIDMMRTEYESNKIAYLRVLSLFVGEDILNSKRLAKPQTPTLGDEILRVELLTFEKQRLIYDWQEKQLRSSFTPRLQAYANGAMSYLNADFSGLGTNMALDGQMKNWSMGVTLNWSISGLYTHGLSKKKLALNRDMLDSDRQSFLFKTSIDLAQQDEQVKKYEQLLQQDKELVSLRASIANAAKAQLENGVITTHEYIQKVNAEHLANQARILHEVQLMQTQYNYKFINGN
ncbi:MAG: TolC family protein [Mangrovibacterium sp.]